MEHDNSMESELDPTVLASLDTERAPAPDLEERTVLALRQQGLLRPAPTPAGQHIARSKSRRISASFYIPLAGVAAATLAFAAGLRVGQRHPSQPSTPLAATAAESSNGALRVRRAAFEYITALSAVRVNDAAARAASIGTFHTVASQIVRLAPESDIGAVIRIALPSSFALSPAAVAVASEPKRIIWF